MSAEEYFDMLGNGKKPYYRIRVGKNGMRISRIGSRTFSLRGKILERQPLKLRFLDVFSIRFAVLYLLLIVSVTVFQNFDVLAALSISVSVFTALYLAYKANGCENARALISDFGLTPVLDKPKYPIFYNYFYFYAIIILGLVYPAYLLLSRVFGMRHTTAVLLCLFSAAAVITLVAATRNVTEILIADREGIIRQNIFSAKDRLIYSAENIESVKVVNRDLKGREKLASFSFEIRIKPEALGRSESKFFKLKEKAVIYLPYNKINAEIIRQKVGIDAESTEYDEFYR